jgi:hypothetical protein
MEENYIHIFCMFLADLLDNNQITIEDMNTVLQEFTKTAENIKSRADLLKFLQEHTGPDYPEFAPLAEQLKDPYHAFIYDVGETN